nr:hypothetical protein Q903MT_gene1913 [Picea sitchensis]
MLFRTRVIPWVLGGNNETRGHVQVIPFPLSVRGKTRGTMYLFASSNKVIPTLLYRPNRNYPHR